MTSAPGGRCLGPDDASIAERCIEARTSVDDPQRGVDGVKAAARLRGREYFASVGARIKDANQRRSSGEAG